MPEKQIPSSKFALTSTTGTTRWILDDRNAYPFIKEQKVLHLSHECHGNWPSVWITALPQIDTSNFLHLWRSWSIQDLYFYPHVKILVCLPLCSPLLVLYDLCLKVQVSLAHPCLQTMWHSWRHSTYPQLLLTGILESSNTGLRQIMVSAKRYKSKGAGAKRQLEEIECIDYWQQGKGNKDGLNSMNIIYISLDALKLYRQYDLYYIDIHKYSYFSFIYYLKIL